MKRNRRFLVAVVSLTVTIGVGCDSANNGYGAFDSGFFQGGTNGSVLSGGTVGFGTGQSGAITAGQSGMAGASGTGGGATDAAVSLGDTGFAGTGMIEDGGPGDGGGPIDILGDTGIGGSGGSADAPVEENPVCDIPDPSEFVVNMGVGSGGTNYKESDHFVLFNAGDPDTVLNFMEAAHKCFVEDWCWVSTGVSRTRDEGIYYKTNIYSTILMGASGVMQYDYALGLSYLEVMPSEIGKSHVTVHEYGHALTLAADGWVDQTNTGLWWEVVAQWVADTFLTSPFCGDARNQFGIPEGDTIIGSDLDTVISNSHWVICMNQNQYNGWPFLTYLTNNPDNYPGIGRMTLPEMWATHQGNNETPLHQLDRMAAPVTAQTIVGRYWARMAFLDIEHPKAQQVFMNSRSRLNFSNLDSIGDQTWRVKANRQPQYMGANINPLSVSGDGYISVQVTNLGNGQTDSNFTATLSIRAGDGSVRYVDCPNGLGQATVGSGEEVSLVVVNTPDTLYMYNPDNPGNPANIGLNYEVQITGAVPSN